MGPTEVNLYSPPTVVQRSAGVEEEDVATRGVAAQVAFERHILKPGLIFKRKGLKRFQSYGSTEFNLHRPTAARRPSTNAFISLLTRTYSGMIVAGRPFLPQFISVRPMTMRRAGEACMLMRV
jgi:hypothetical protein